MTNTENKEVIGTLVMREKNKLTVDDGKSSVVLLIGKGKSFDLEITKQYSFMCGVSNDKKLWLNEITEVKLPKSKEIVVPKNTEDYKQFQTDKRTALITAVDMSKDRKEIESNFEFIMSLLVRYYR